jgi:hypothetical protein
MRAICGAIITAGALIGLGQTAMALGTRYAYAQPTNLERDPKVEITPLHLYQVDKPLVFIIVFLTSVAIIGLGIAFLGLAYHHRRRHHEMLRDVAIQPGVPHVHT